MNDCKLNILYIRNKGYQEEFEKATLVQIIRDALRIREWQNMVCMIIIVCNNPVTIRGCLELLSFNGAYVH